MDGDDQPVVPYLHQVAQYLNDLSIKDGLQPVYEEGTRGWVPVLPLRNGYRATMPMEWAARFAGQTWMSPAHPRPRLFLPRTARATTRTSRRREYCRARRHPPPAPPPGGRRASHVANEHELRSRRQRRQVHLDLPRSVRTHMLDVPLVATGIHVAGAPAGRSADRLRTYASRRALPAAIAAKTGDSGSRGISHDAEHALVEAGGRRRVGGVARRVVRQPEAPPPAAPRPPAALREDPKPEATRPRRPTTRREWRFTRKRIAAGRRRHVSGRHLTSRAAMSAVAIASMRTRVAGDGVALDSPSFAGPMAAS